MNGFCKFRCFVLSGILSIGMLLSTRAQSAPYAFTQSPGPVNPASAVFSGMATPNGIPSLAWFEWGTNNAFNRQTAVTNIGGGYNVVRVSAAVTGLNFGGDYACRLVVSNAADVTHGAAQSFTTGCKVALWQNSATNWPANLTNAVAIAGYGSHFLAIRNDGTVAAWGSNTYGESSVPTGLTNVVAISCGNRHSVALKADGTVSAWGVSSVVGETAVPTGLSNVVAIATGNGHNLVLKNDGTVVAWGENEFGQANVPVGLTNIVAVACGGWFSLALRNDGTIAGWGSGDNGPLSFPGNLTNVVAITAGTQLTVVLEGDGTVWALGAIGVGGGWWMANYSGALTGPGNTRAIAAGGNDAIWLGADGMLTNSVGTTVPPGLSNVVAISSGWLALAPNAAPQTVSQTVSGFPNSDLSITLTVSDVNSDPLTLRVTSLPAAGALYQFNNGARGPAITQVNTPVSDSGGRVIFAPVADSFGSPYASFSFVANDGLVDSALATVTVNMSGIPYAFTRPAIKVHATDACLSGMATPNGLATSAWWEWGLTSAYGHTTTPTNAGSATSVTLVKAGISNLTLGATYHFRLVVSNAAGVTYGSERLFTTGRNVTQFQSSPVAGLSNLVAIAGGGLHSLGLRNDGTVVAWGSNSNGQTNVPAGLSNIVQIAGGGAHSLAVGDDGTAYGWGDHSQNAIPYQLGGILEMAGGAYHTLALKFDGTVIGFGAYSHNLGQVTPPAGLSNVVAVSAGVNHSLALKNDGTVVAWGNDTYGQLDVPSGLSNVVAIAAGSYHSLALQKDGTMVTWGTWNFNTVPLPSGLSNVVEIAAGYAFNLGMAADGTIAGGAPVPGFLGGVTVPGGMDGAVHLAANSYDALAMANLPPGASSTTATGPANRDITITLSGSDANLDALGLRVTTLPASGQLFQFNSGARGDAITAPDTVVTDPQGRIIFAPATNGFGVTTFIYVANDGWVDSAPALVTLTTTAAARAVTGQPTLLNPSNAVLNGWVTGGGLPASAWFEWGTNSSFGQKTVAGNFDIGLTGTLLSTPLALLAPGGEYHFRLAVSNAATVVYGAEKIFTTGKPVLAWGVNNYGQTSVPATLTNTVALAGGAEYSLALSGDGTVMGWGRNDAGQASPPPGLSNVTAIAAGVAHSLALLSDGSVVAWGTNNFGQTNVSAGLGSVMTIAAGANHNLALCIDGSVASWGLNTSGQTNVPAGLNNVVAISAGWSHSLALKFDGTLAGWGSQTPPAGVSNVTAIVSAGNHNLALLSNGTVTAWGGANSYGENNVPATLTNAVAIAAGTNHSIALRQDGTIFMWGRNDLGQSSLPPVTGACLGIAGGGQHTLALVNSAPPLPFATTEPPGPVRGTSAMLRGMATGNGTGTLVWFEWGTNSVLGATTAPEPLTDGGSVTVISNALAGLKPFTAYCCRLVVSNAVGVVSGRTVFFTTGGRVRSWGVAGSGQTNLPVALAGVVAVSAGTTHAVALLNDGTVSAWGNNDYGQTTVPSVATNIIAVAAGGAHTLALTADGRVKAWGRNSDGQTTVPVTLTDVVAIAAGDRHSLALRSDGSVVAWGNNGSGQTNVPSWLNNVVAIAAGGNGSMALKQDGIAIVWGRPTSLPANVSMITAIAAGTNNNILLKRDGSVAVGGDNTYGQTNVPAWVSNVVDVAVGDLHSAALKTNRTVIAWMGYYPGSTSQTNVPSDLTNVVAISVAGSYNLALVAGTQPPRAITLPPAPAGPASTTFIGAAVMNDRTALAWFEWGTNGTFGQTTSSVLLSSTNYAGFVSSTVNGLVPGGIYSCRLVLSNTVGFSYGPEQRFTTGRKMVAWGQDTSGQTDLPSGLSNVVMVSGGQAHSAALLNNGAVRVWGSGTFGQTNEPASATNVIAIASGGFHLLALRSDHTVVGWGLNNSGQTTIPAGATNVLAIACGQNHSLALRADGKVIAWGNNGYGQAAVPSNLTDVVGIAGGGRHSLALKSDGTVRAWGDSSSGQTNVPIAASNLVAVAAGDSYSLGLRSDGTIVAWGSWSTPVGDNANLIAIAAGYDHFLAIKTNGTMVGWGNNLYGQSSAPAGGIASLAAGAYHSLAIGPNLPPATADQSVIGAVNQEQIVVPSAFDPNGDAVNFRIGSLPLAGALYQYDAGERGQKISMPNTPPTDSLGRVIFVPGTDAAGWPYASFTFIANDGEADSPPATTTVNIIFVPVISANAWANSEFSFHFAGDANASYRVWMSTNLVNWSDLGAVDQTLPGLFQFIDTSVTNGSPRFYRVTCP